MTKLCTKIKSKTGKKNGNHLGRLNYDIWKQFWFKVYQQSKTTIKQNYALIQEERKGFNPVKVKKRTSSEIDKTLSIQEVKSKKAGKGRELKWRKCHFKNKEINCLILLSRRGILKTKVNLAYNQFNSLCYLQRLSKYF